VSLGFFIALFHYIKDKNASLQDFRASLFGHAGKQNNEGVMRKS